MDEIKKVVAQYVSQVTTEVKENIRQAIMHQEVMPSMRAMMTAGKALDRDNTAGYNCSYLPVDDPKAFDEAMYILMCGTGVGFSVERDKINKLPEIPHTLYDSDDIISVHDSKEGWAKALRKLIALLYAARQKDAKKHAMQYYLNVILAEHMITFGNNLLAHGKEKPFRRFQIKERLLEKRL